MVAINDLIDFKQTSFWVSLGCIIFNPIYWNIVARREFKHKTLTKTVGDPYYGCYVLAASIFFLGLFRDHVYKLALEDQPKLALLQFGEVRLAAMLLWGAGSILVVSSMWALGVTGTYLGDYFGILMDEKVESFPFNVTGDPMYYGSFMCFLGTALWYASPAGILLSGIVLVEYLIALEFEGPFTNEIYAARERKRAAVGSGQKKKKEL